MKKEGFQVIKSLKLVINKEHALIAMFQAPLDGAKEVHLKNYAKERHSCENNYFD